MPTQRAKEKFQDGITPDDMFLQIAEKLNPAGVGEIKSRAWQWKFDLEQGKKDRFDLYDELGKAPAKYIYLPGPTQMAAHRAPVKTKQVSGGWRAGKSKWLAAEILPYMFRDNAQIWIAANNYILARYEFQYIWDWLKWLNAPIEQVSHPATGRWFLRLAWGAVLETQTVDDVTNIEGGNLDCAAVAEAGLVAADVVRRLRGRTAEKRGPILMAGSLDASEPWYLNTFEEFKNGPTEELSWHSFGIPSWENSIAFPGGREDEAIVEWEATLSPDEFKLKVCAEVAKPEELVFPEFDKGTHVMDFKFGWEDSNGYRLDYPESIMDELGTKTRQWLLPERGPIHLAIDPGFNGAYAVLAIRKYDDYIFVIDEVYARRWMVEDVIKECKSRSWWASVDYAVMDIAGKQHDAMASHLDIWNQPHNLGFKPATNYVPIPDGIQHLRTFLKHPSNQRPRVWVSPNCQGLISEFSLYRYRQAKDNRAEKEEPIDRDNHSIKALTYYVFDRFSPAKSGRTKSEKYIKHMDFEGYTKRNISDWMSSY